MRTNSILDDIHEERVHEFLNDQVTQFVHDTYDLLDEDWKLPSWIDDQKLHFGAYMDQADQYYKLDNKFWIFYIQPFWEKCQEEYSETGIEAFNYSENDMLELAINYLTEDMEYMFARIRFRYKDGKENTQRGKIGLNWPKCNLAGFSQAFDSFLDWEFWISEYLYDDPLPESVDSIICEIYDVYNPDICVLRYEVSADEYAQYLKDLDKE